MVDKIIKKEQQQELAPVIKNTIQRLIILNGNRFQLDIEPVKDMAIKDKINKSTISILEIKENVEYQETSSFIDNFWGSLDENKKFLLIFFLGQIAKDGALGYHHGVNNQANDFFYTLTRYYTEKLRSKFNEPQDNKQKAITNLLNKLKNGECIEAATNTFMINLELSDIWQQN